MDILGVSCYFHDAAAALIRDGQLVAAVEEERFSRKKAFATFARSGMDVLVLGDCVVEKRASEATAG